MKRIRCAILLGCLAGVGAVNANTVAPTDENSGPSLEQNIVSLHALQADWTFSGMVTNESGERYHYFFQIQRNNARYHGIATVIDGQKNSVVIYEESSALIEQSELTHWQVGNLFLRFNPINNSWVFGVKNKGKKGFNFKVDMLGLSNTQLSKKQILRTGVELLVSQTGRLNGHLQADENSKEEFITAKKAWFRQVWVSKPQIFKHPLTAILCEFNDGSAFYSVTLPEPDVLRGSIAGWRDEEGKTKAMSQFVTVDEEKDNLWQIRIPSPKASLSFSNLLAQLSENHGLVVGINKGNMPGFCAISKDDIQEEQV